MKLQSVQTRNSKRPGRGISAGQGKTAGRGTKGQKSRSGFNIPNRHEGGQTPLAMRLPKLPGFKSLKRKSAIISLDIISANFKNGEVVSLETLESKKLIQKGEKAKVLNNGKLTVKVTFDSSVKVSKNVGVSSEPKNLPAVEKENLPEVKEDLTPEVKEDKTPAKPAKKTSAKKTAK